MSSGGMHPHPEALCYHITLDALESAKAENDEFRKKQLIVTALVFSALCLEAFINQEYASHPETAKILEDNDYLPLETKWLMLPLLLGSHQTFNKGATPFQTFHKLVRIRNQRLVHFKPAKEKRLSGEEYDEEYFGELVGNVDLTEKYVKCVGDMIRKLNQLTGGKTDVPKFLEGVKYLSSVWASVTAQFESQ